MPDENIYIDSSFLSPSSGTVDNYVSYTTNAAENIGLREVIATYERGLTFSGSQNVDLLYTILSGTSGFESTAVDFNSPYPVSGTENIPFECYVTDTLISGIPLNYDMEYSTGYFKASGTLNYDIEYINTFTYSGTNSIFHQYWIYEPQFTELNYLALYTADVPSSGTKNYPAEFELNTVSSGSQNVNVDLTLAGYVFDFHPYDLSYWFDLICGLATTSGVHKFEAQVISGSLIPVDYDVYSATLASGHYNFDAYSSLEGSEYCIFESQTISGTVGYYFHDLYCTVSGINSYNFDIDLFSLKISNFSLDEGEYVNVSGTICADVTDDIHNVVISGTYFIIDGTIISGSEILHTPITDGYRVCYDPSDDFASILGPTEFIVHAENDNDDVLEESFYLTSGYSVSYNNETQDYGFNNQVVVRMSAENLASCPISATDAYRFTSTPKTPRDLSASIVGVPWSIEDLGASITPTTDTIYFYGKVFTIEVRAKDFAGNEMEPYVFEFTIEDKPE